MDIVELIRNQGNEIFNIYDILSGLMDSINNDKEETDLCIKKLIYANNNNVENINKRLNIMDMDITDNNKIQSNKRVELSEELDKTIKENNKRNGIYKTELIKKINKIKRESNDRYK